MDDIINQQKKLIIDAEIEAGLRRRQSILDDLTRIEKVYTDALKTHGGEMAVLQAQKQSLHEQIQKLTDEIDFLDKTSKGLAEKISSYEEENKTRIKAEAEAILFEAMNVAAEADTKKRMAEDTAKYVYTKEQDLLVLEQRLNEDANEQKKTREELEKTKADVEGLVESKTSELSLLKSQEENARVNLAELETATTQVTERLTVSSKRLEDIRGEIDNSLVAIDTEKKSLITKAEALSRKEEDLRLKEIWLTDREQTVGRAYQEVISKGGKING